MFLVFVLSQALSENENIREKDLTSLYLPSTDVDAKAAPLPELFKLCLHCKHFGHGTANILAGMSLFLGKARVIFSVNGADFLQFGTRA